MDANLLMKADEVAKELGLGRSKVYEMMASRQLPVVLIGQRAVRVNREALCAWIARHTEIVERES